MQGVWSSKSSSLLAPISIPQKPDAFGAQASNDSTIKTAALQASMQPQPAPTPQVMPFVGFVAEASHLFWLYVYQTLHAPCSVSGGECNRPAWATRTGLQEPCRDRAFAHRRRKCQRGIRTEK